MLSVLSALRQTRPPVQVLVLCDCCSDGTADAVRRLGDERLAAVELEKGPGYAYGHRNQALNLARGSVVIWLGDDDLLLPDHLERIGEYWDTGDVDLVTTPAALVHPDDAMEWIGQDWSVPWNRESMLRNNTNVMSSVSIRVDLARGVGGWDAAIPRAADWDLWKRVLATGATAAMTSEPTVLHFRATGRNQEWPLRVRQNSAWLDRISDPARLPDVRRMLRRLNAEHEADLRGQLEVARSDAETARSDADAARSAQEELQRIYEGGWWKLRERLLPLFRLFGKGDVVN